MFEQFTVEEINLMCIFDTSGRSRLISELTEAMQGFDNPELAEIAANALKKLNNMSDLEFAAIELYPEYGDNDETEV
jgi:hypothetical protein